MLLLLVVPAAAQGATVTVTGGTTLQFAGEGTETNTGVIAEQAPGVYFVGDQTPGVIINSDAATSLLCPAAPPPLPAGRLCILPAVNALVMDLGDGNDTGVINDTDGTPGTINGGAGSDQLVGGLENDTFQGGGDSDTVAYAGISQTGLTLTRTAAVTAILPERPGGPVTTGNGQAGESDTINPDVEGLVGGNGNDNLTGSEGPDTIAGAVPLGTPLVTTMPAGVDTIDGKGGADTLLGGDSGSVTGGAGADQIVGGRSATATTVIHGGADNDTLVSGLGDDNLFGDGGFNTLAYASVAQGALTVVNRGTNGVTASLPNSGQTASGGRTSGGGENDTIHDDIQTLVGSNGSDALGGSNRADVILGVAPAGTPGVVPGPPGNDALTGGGGVDVLLGAGGNDLIRSRDGLVESPGCGGGTDTVTADPTDTPAADCERVDTGATVTPGGGGSGGGGSGGGQTLVKDTTKPRLAERPAVFGLRRGRRVVLRLACPNEASGCRGTFALRTRRRFRLGRGRAKRVTLARVKFRTTGTKSKRLSIKLSRRVVQLVRHGRSLRLIGAATIKDSSGNRTKTSVRLRLRRR